MLSTYVGWLSKRIGGNAGYFFLLNKLSKLEFYSVNELDEARIADALMIREDFILDCPDTWNKDIISNSPVSVLEVLISLAEKIDKDLMWRPDEDRTSKWFWIFIENLNLDGCTDANWSVEDEEFIADQISKFVSREYKSNGEGGNIFIAEPENTLDMRKQSLWEQAWAWMTRDALELEEIV